MASRNRKGELAPPGCARRRSAHPRPPGVTERRAWHSIARARGARAREASPSTSHGKLRAQGLMAEPAVAVDELAAAVAAAALAGPEVCAASAPPPLRAHPSSATKGADCDALGRPGRRWRHRLRQAAHHLRLPAHRRGAHSAVRRTAACSRTPSHAPAPPSVEWVTGTKAHVLLRRGMFFAHRRAALAPSQAGLRPHPRLRRRAETSPRCWTPTRRTRAASTCTRAGCGPPPARAAASAPHDAHPSPGPLLRGAPPGPPHPLPLHQVAAGRLQGAPGHPADG